MTSINDSNKDKEYPFTAVIVTFPDKGAAQVAKEGPLCDLQVLYPKTTFLATCDPLGCRCGSGGGTLAALAELWSAQQEGNKNNGGSGGGSILILHAGGDSSRCFTQMSLGKAWTNLPLLMDDSTGQQILSNPILLGMDSIARIFSQSHCLPPGSIVIAASDALLSVPHYNLSADTNPPKELGSSSQDAHVLGVTFPAPFETAQNHGVYVLRNDYHHQEEEEEEPPPTKIAKVDSNDAARTTKTPSELRELQVPIQQVLQKPSLETLREQPFVTFGNMNDDSKNNSQSSTDGGMAWIDNGIIAFLPPAAKALQALANGILKTSTKNGLLEEYDKRQASEPTITYQSVTHKVDLYTHFLQALTIAGTLKGASTEGNAAEAEHRNDYLSNHAKDLPTEVANGIFDTLSPYKFQALAIPEGKFLHLGTTRELIDFYVYGCKKKKSKTAATTRHELYTQNCTYFGQELGMIPRMTVFAQWNNNNNNNNDINTPTPAKGRKRIIGQDCVIMGCILEGNDTSSSIGKGTVMEFCNLTASQSIQIGNNCLVSGLRSSMSSSSSSPCKNLLQIPDDTCMQMMPLINTDNNKANKTNQEESFVGMALGINDPIKKSIDQTTIFGITMKTFLQCCGLTPQDLWEEGDSQTIWNAKLHPIIKNNNLESAVSPFSIWEWLNHLPTNKSDGSDGVPDNGNTKNLISMPSLIEWKNQPRLSLKQVRDLSDAASEFRYRHDLVHKVIPQRHSDYCEEIVRILMQRKHDECNFYPLLLTRADEDGGKKTSTTTDGDDDVTTTTSTTTMPMMELLTPQALLALQTLETVISNTLVDDYPNQYDVCGRALMVESALLDDLAKRGLSGVANNEDDPTTTEAAATTTRSGILEKCSPYLQIIQSHASTGKDRSKAFLEIVALRRGQDTNNADPVSLKVFSELMESMARVMTEICVAGFLQDNITRGSNNKTTTTTNKLSTPVYDQWVIATSPARVDLAGGWSDTPPICYEYGARVTGMAVTVDQKKPLSCRCRILSTTAVGESLSSPSGIIFIRSELRDSKTCALMSHLDVCLKSLDDLRDARNPGANGALIKSALVCLGLVTLDMLQQEKQDDDDGTTLQACVDKFCQSPNGVHVRMEIVVTSLLPQGSGMGTSSILGGCVLAALGRCVGIEPDGDTGIIDSVSVLEQILSTGGGFQDQVNGLIGGVKTVSCKAGELPIKLKIEPAKLDPAFQKKLDDNLLLAFSGKTRLAANLLQNVLRRFARRTPEVVACMQGLVDGAQRARDAMTSGDLETLGDCLHTYYGQKKHMAGEDSGVEPEAVRLLLENLRSEKLILGGSLCGAGGGGFLAMIATPGATKERIHSVVEDCLKQFDDETHSSFSWHDCSLSNDGLKTSILSSNGSVDDFDATWHS